MANHQRYPGLLYAAISAGGRGLAMALLALLLLGCEEAEVALSPLELRLQVTDYGQYQLRGSETEGAELLRQRRKLALDQQTSFGFRFILRGDAVDRPISLTFEVTPPNSEQGLKSLRKTVQIVPEQLPYTGQFIHILADPESLVPGTWVITLKADQELLTRQPFQLLPAAQP